MFVLDPYDRLLLMHRSDKVRSAKNVWSVPSGEHELGETAFECSARELREEYGLEIECLQFLDQYENIAGDDPANEQYHWVITLMMARVADVTRAINREPDKHDIMKFIPFQLMAKDDFLKTFVFHESLQMRLMLSAHIYVDQMQWFLHPQAAIEEPAIFEESITQGQTTEVPLSGPVDEVYTDKNGRIAKGYGAIPKSLSQGQHQYDEE